MNDSTLDAFTSILVEAATLAVTVGTVCYLDGDGSKPYTVKCADAGRVTAIANNTPDMVLAMPVREFLVTFAPVPLFDSAADNEVIGEIVEDAKSLPYLADTEQCIAAAVMATIDAFREGTL